MKTVYILESRYIGSDKSPFVSWVAFATKEKAEEYLFEHLVDLAAMASKKYVDMLEYRISKLAYYPEE